MRKFYILAFDPKLTNHMSIEKHEKNNFQISLLWRAEKINNSNINLLKNDLKLYVNNKKTKSDLIGNSFSGLIFSEKLLSKTKILIENDVQIIEINLINNADSQLIKSYFLIHPYVSYKCLDIKKTKHEEYEGTIILGDKIVIKSNVIPKQANIFRLEENPTYILISEEFVDSISDSGIKGVTVIPCDSI